MANATKYFDLNGATAGFGTLTGAWNTAGAAFWSDSSAGTVVPTNYTFDNTDTAAFGFAGTTATAGIATIAAGLTVTLNKIVTANLAALQTIAAGAGGGLTLAGTTPTIDVGSAGGLSITSAITGTAGFTKAGTGTLTLTAISTGMVGGIVTTSAGSTQIGTNTAAVNTNIFPNINGWGITGPGYNSYVSLWHGTNASYTLKPLTGAGVLRVAQSSTATSTANFIAVDLSNFSGTISPNSTSDASSRNGFIRVSSINTQAPATTFSIDFRSESGVATTFTQDITFPATATVNNTVAIPVGFSAAVAGAVINPWSSSITANQNLGKVLIGAVTRSDGTASTITLTFQGSNAENNEVSGVISNGTAAYSIRKADAGKWILSGANTYTGTTTISAGTLSAQGTSGTKTPLGGSGAVTTSSTGVLDISSTGTDAANPMIVDKTTRTVTLGSTGNPQLTSTTGFNRLDCGSVVLSTDLLVSVAADAYLKLNNSAAMTGVSRSATKTGDGEFDFGTFANQFSSTSGTVIVSAGTASFGASVAANAAGPLGQSTSTAIDLGATLKYNGAAAGTLSRAVRLTGSAAFEAAGTVTAAKITVSSAITHSAAGTRTITLKGANAGDNEFSTVIANNGVSAVSVTKSGDSKWIISSQPTYTGLTTVSAGELQFNELNLSNNLTVNGTGKLSKTVLDGSGKTITCDNGTPEIVATTSANTVNGTTSVTGGTLRLTTEVSVLSKPAKVLGDTNTTVSALAAIRTSTGTQQRGQMRYGGNLTFSATSSLYIGG